MAPSYDPNHVDDSEDDEGVGIVPSGEHQAAQAEYDDAFIDDWLNQDSGNMAPFSIYPTQFELLHGQGICT